MNTQTMTRKTPGTILTTKARHLLLFGWWAQERDVLNEFQNRMNEIADLAKVFQQNHLIDEKEKIRIEAMNRKFTKAYFK